MAIALLAWASLRRRQELTRVSFAMFAIVAILGVVVYLTGEPAEELVEDLPDVSHDIIEAHEEAAFAATLLLGALGAVAGGGLVALRRAAAVPRTFAGGCSRCPGCRPEPWPGRRISAARSVTQRFAPTRRRRPNSPPTPHTS